MPGAPLAEHQVFLCVRTLQQYASHWQDELELSLSPPLGRMATLSWIIVNHPSDEI